MDQLQVRPLLLRVDTFSAHPRRQIFATRYRLHQRLVGRDVVDPSSQTRFHSTNDAFSRKHPYQTLQIVPHLQGHSLQGRYLTQFVTEFVMRVRKEMGFSQRGPLNFKIYGKVPVGIAALIELVSAYLPQFFPDQFQRRQRIHLRLLWSEVLPKKIANDCTVKLSNGLCLVAKIRVRAIINR